MGSTYTEKSTGNNGEWIGEETEESASQGVAETSGGPGEFGTTPMLTADGPERSGAETRLGGAAAGGGATSDTTAVEADAAVAGAAMRQESGKWRGFLASRKTRP